MRHECSKWFLALSPIYSLVPLPAIFLCFRWDDVFIALTIACLIWNSKQAVMPQASIELTPWQSATVVAFTTCLLVANRLLDN